jgi:DNA polymerase-3 subunit alpha
MRALFSYVPEALENTAKIAGRCNVEIVFNEYKLPKFKLPGSEPDPYEYLRKLCYQGLEKRYDPVTPELRERMDSELEMLRGMDFIDYFLIVWDFIRYARENGGQHRCILPVDNEHRPDKARADIRAVFEPRAGIHARYRY